MLVGKWLTSEKKIIEQAFENALHHKDKWPYTGKNKSGHFRKMADLMEQHAAIIWFRGTWSRQNPK